MSSYEEEEEDNNPFQGGFSQMDFPCHKDQQEQQGSNKQSPAPQQRIEKSADLKAESSLKTGSNNKSNNHNSSVSAGSGSGGGNQSVSPFGAIDEPTISIIDANKTSDGHSAGGFITYTISYNDTLIRRRYREFESLRNSLAALFPTIIVPPIPTKQTLTDILSSATSVTSKATGGSANLVNSTNNLDGFVGGHSDSLINIIDHRKRMLSIFLNRCLRIPKIQNCEVFQRFLNPNLTWNDVLGQYPLSQLPRNPLQCDPIHPEKSTHLHSLMPLPTSSPFTTTSTMNILSSINKSDTNQGDDSHQAGNESQSNNSGSSSNGNTNNQGHRRSASEDLSELSSRTIENNIMTELDKVDKKCNKYLAHLSSISSELGILYNALSLQESDQQSEALLLEKVSTNYDQSYLNLENLYQNLYLNYSEPLMELSQFSDITKKLIKFKNKKLAQLNLIGSELARKEKNLKNLTVGYNAWENSRLNEVLSKIENERASKTSSPSNNSTGASSSTSAAATGTAQDSAYAGINSRRFKIPGVNKLTSVFKERIYDSDPLKTHRDKVNKLIFEVDQLKKMQELAKHDFDLLEKEVDNELLNYEKYFKSIEFKKLLLQFVKHVLELARKNLESWEEFKSVVEKS